MSKVDAFIQQLMDEREQKVQVIENLVSVAADEQRDLRDTDSDTITKMRSRIGELDTQIERVSGDLELAETVRTRIKYLGPDSVSREFQYRSAGDYLWDAFHLQQDRAAHERWTKFHKRAAEHMGFDKANTIPVAGGFNGLVVNPVVGAVLDPTPEGRPLFAALGVRPIESGTFLRPRIVDPNMATGVGPQGQEKSELPSKAWDILSEPVTADVIGGYINISQLLLEMVPSGFDMIVTHMNRRLERASEVAAVAAMDLTTEEVPLAAGATSADVSAALGDAATIVFANTGRLPTWIAMGPQGWGRLIGLTDLAGRPMIPAVGPVNALGAGGSPDTFFTSLAGMRVVVSHAITTPNLYMSNSYGLEVYERKLPVLQAVEPSVFGRQLSVQTMLAFYSPITNETGPERNGVVRIEWAAV